MSFLYGVLGTLAVLVLFSGGVFAGYRIRGKVDAFRRPKPESVEEKELVRLKEQQKAFNALQNYSVEQAYGQLETPFGTNEGGDDAWAM